MPRALLTKIDSCVFKILLTLGARRHNRVGRGDVCAGTDIDESACVRADPHEQTDTYKSPSVAPIHSTPLLPPNIGAEPATVQFNNAN